MDKPSRLKLAVQKSGRLTDLSTDLLVRCGLKFSRAKDQLLGYGENMPLDLLFVRDDDIPDLVEEDVCDLGLVGLNVIEEKRLNSRLAAKRRGSKSYGRSTSDAVGSPSPSRKSSSGPGPPRSRDDASPPPIRSHSRSGSPTVIFAPKS